MGTNLNKSPVHLGYIDEIHRLNTEFDVIELIQSIQTIQSSRVDDKTFADSNVCDWMTPTCRHWLTVQSCNAEIGELHSHAMQTYGNGTAVQCRHLGIIVSGHADIGRLYIRATQILGAYIVVLYRHCVIGQSCS